MAEFLLIAELQKLSHSRSWNTMKLEWALADVVRVSVPETCLCGHYPIIEVCTIKNKVTGFFARVGNCCVKKFNRQSERIFRSIANARREIVNSMSSFCAPSLNQDTIDFAYNRGWITTWEFDFYSDIWRKRVLSQKQNEIKRRVNQKIFNAFDKKTI